MRVITNLATVRDYTRSACFACSWAASRTSRAGVVVSWMGPRNTIPLGCRSVKRRVRLSLRGRKFMDERLTNPFLGAAWREHQKALRYNRFGARWNTAALVVAILYVIYGLAGG